MPKTQTALSLALAFVGVALAAAPSRAQFDDPVPATDPATASASSEIRDAAGMFGREAVREALAKLVSVERSYRVPTTIETIESLRGEPIDEVTQRMARRLGPQGRGIYILIASKDHRAEVIVSRENQALNVRAKRIVIRDAFLEDFRKDNYDGGLKHGAEVVEKTVAATLGEPAKPATVATTIGTVTTLPRTADIVGSPMVRRNQSRLTLAGAKRVVAAAEAKAAEIGLKVNIAVVDDGGHLLAFSRMDDARPSNVAVALTKATAAATGRIATGPAVGSGTKDAPDVLLNLGLQNAAEANGAKFTTLPGGVPIVVDGQVIGAIGLAGGTTDQDAEVARSAIAQFLADVQAPAAVVAPK